MIDSNYTTANDFWRTRKTYPSYPHTHARRVADIDFVSLYAKDAVSICDIGCGDGHVVLALRVLDNGVKKFYAFDQSEKLLDILIRKWGPYPGLTVVRSDVLEEKKFPKADITLALGCFPYIFDDNHLLQVLGKVSSPLLIVRAPCTLDSRDVVINKYSVELEACYAGIYRTVENYCAILDKVFAVEKVKRAYPDPIESKYGTKQFFFVCRKNEAACT